MSFLGTLRDLVSPGAKIRVHIIIKGRIGEGWYDVDRTLKVPVGTTLGQLMEIAESRSIPLRDAIDRSPHLRHTLMLNGDRCPVAEHLDRVMQEADQLYLLAPLAGG